MHQWFLSMSYPQLLTCRGVQISSNELKPCEYQSATMAGKHSVFQIQMYLFLTAVTELINRVEIQVSTHTHEGPPRDV